MTKNQHGFSKERLFLINLISIFKRISGFTDKEKCHRHSISQLSQGMGASSIKRWSFYKTLWLMNYHANLKELSSSVCPWLMSGWRGRKCPYWLYKWPELEEELIHCIADSHIKAFKHVPKDQSNKMENSRLKKVRQQKLRTVKILTWV